MDTDMAAPGFERIVADGAQLDQIASGLIFGEGPVWNSREGHFRWVDIVGDTIWQWTPGLGKEIVLRPSGKANGMTYDRQGRLIVAGWGARTVWRMEQDGSIVTLASHYQGLKINSPNDIVCKADGAIYFTDPVGGLYNVGHAGQDVQRYLDVSGIYRIAPDGSELRLVVDDAVYPNGLCFSPDEQLLYINDTRLAHIRVFDVQPDGSCANGRLFYQLVGDEPGVADGMKCDVEGNVYVTGPAGIHVVDPNGRLLGRLKIPAHATNLSWGGDDWRSLYITTYGPGCVYRIRLNVPGVPVEI